MKEQFLSDKVEIDMGHQDDPFTRKKERMKVCWDKVDYDGTSYSRSLFPSFFSKFEDLFSHRFEICIEYGKAAIFIGSVNHSSNFFF